MSETLYDILGVRVTASKEEIRAAYLARIKTEHPDVNPDSDTDLIVRLNAARDTLLDDEQRALYDSYGLLPEIINKSEDSELEGIIHSTLTALPTEKLLDPGPIVSVWKALTVMLHNAEEGITATKHDIENIEKVYRRLPEVKPDDLVRKIINMRLKRRKEDLELQMEKKKILLKARSSFSKYMNTGYNNARNNDSNAQQRSVFGQDS